MDTFIAALKVGPGGKVIGVDMTDAQRAKAERLRDRDGFTNVTYIKGYIEEVPFPDGSADVVISNGVINLAPDKTQGVPRGCAPAEARRTTGALRYRHGSAATGNIVCNSTLWAACIGGASQQDNYRR